MTLLSRCRWDMHSERGCASSSQGVEQRYPMGVAGGRLLTCNVVDQIAKGLEA